MLVWKLWTVYARMFAVTAILSCVIKIRELFKSTKWRHFENVKFEALSAWHVINEEEFNMLQTLHLETLNELTGIDRRMEAEHRSLVEKSLMEEINELKKNAGTKS